MKGCDISSGPDPEAHAWQPSHLKLAVEAAGVALWAWNVDDDSFTMDERGFDLWGLPWRKRVTFEELSEHIHPADRDRVGVGEAAATSLAMVVHELATNSLKYGSLSSATGTLDVSSYSEGDKISLVWVERGGPAVAAPTGVGGFGGKLVERSVARQLGGTIEHEWLEGGVVVTLQLDRAKLSQ